MLEPNFEQFAVAKAALGEVEHSSQSADLITRNLVLHVARTAKLSDAAGANRRKRTRR
jgi:hypothetical protein